MPKKESGFRSKESSVNTLLQTAKQGDRNSIGILCDRYRDCLTRLSFLKLDSRIRPRESVSDVVQQTCFEAYRDISKFRGSTEGEFGAWLKQILKNNIAHIIQRHVLSAKRSVKKEHHQSDKSSNQILFANEISSSKSSPSRVAMRKEDIERLMIMLKRLPQDQHQAVKLRHIEGMRIADISRIMERSDDAVGALLKRGLQYLRQHLKEM